MSDTNTHRSSTNTGPNGKHDDNDSLIVKVSDRDKDEPVRLICSPSHDSVALWCGADLLESFTVSQWRQFVSGTLGAPEAVKPSWTTVHRSRD